MCIYDKNDLENIQEAMASYDSTPKVIVISDDRGVKTNEIMEHLCIHSPKIQHYLFTSMHSSKILPERTELENFCEQIKTIFNIPAIQLSCWDDTWWCIAKQVEHGNCVLILNEINQLSKSNEAIAGCLFTLWECKFKHIKGFTLMLCSSSADWATKNITDSAGWYGRICWVKEFKKDLK